MIGRIDKEEDEKDKKFPSIQKHRSSAPSGSLPRWNNRSPKGNMWSAIPAALLCMIVNLSEGKQGIEGDIVL